MIIFMLVIITGMVLCALAGRESAAAKEWRGKQEEIILLLSEMLR